LKQFKNHLMLKILEGILTGYDDLIRDRLCGIHPSKDRKGLGV